MSRKRINRNLTKLVSLLVISFIAVSTFLVGYLNSRSLDVRKSDAYQGEPCNSSGLTRCYSSTQVEVCDGKKFNVSNCSTGSCSSSTGRCSTPTPTPTTAPTCSSGQTRCVNNNTQVQVCSGGVWQTASNCSTGVCSTQTDACATPTPAPTCSSGQTRCADDTTLEICSGGVWYQSSCGDRTCNQSSGVCSTPTPYPPIGECFLAGTKVATTNGSINIEDLTTIDSVLSFDDDNNDKINNSKVLNVYERTRDHYYKVSTGNQTVNVTAEHPFYSGNGTYTKTKDLKVGSTVYLLSENQLKADIVSKIEKVNEEVKVYNLTVDQDHTYFANNFAVHNKIGLTPAEKCTAEAANQGLLGAKLSASFKLTSVKNFNYNYCKPDEIYLNWFMTSYKWPGYAASCCVKPEDNNTAQNGYCGGLTPAKVVSYFTPVGGAGFTEIQTESLPNYTCTSTVDSCFRDYPNYPQLINKNVLKVVDGAARYINSDLPTNVTPASCTWLGTSTQARYCCP